MRSSPKQYADPFCRPLHRPGKKTIAGGPAREVRLSLMGGIPGVIAMASRLADEADALVFERESQRLPKNVIALPRKSKAA